MPTCPDAEPAQRARGSFGRWQRSSKECHERNSRRIQRRLAGPVRTASANLPQSAGARRGRRQLLWRIQTVSGSLPHPVSWKDRVR
jgi:hypothetical protein